MEESDEVQRLASLSQKEIDAEVQRLLGCDLKALRAAPPLPEAPLLPTEWTAAQVLRKTQAFVSSFGYDHVGEQYGLSVQRAVLCKKRDRGLAHVTHIAKELCREGLPIRCVDAVFLAIYLTTGRQGMQRFPLSFRTRQNGKSFAHIVMAVKANELWGSLGISRRRTLGFKPLRFAKLSHLVAEFRRSYEDIGHSVEKVIVGLPVSHDIFSKAPVQWRALRLNTFPRTAKQGGAGGAGGAGGGGASPPPASDADNDILFDFGEESVEHFAAQQSPVDAANDEEAWAAVSQVLDDFADKARLLLDWHARTGQLPPSWRRQGCAKELMRAIRERS